MNAIKMYLKERRNIVFKKDASYDCAVAELAAMQERIEKLTEYPERLQKAITDLKALITPTLSRSQQERIAGKIEGVKLALGYFEEMNR